jgi:ribosomal protein L11 methyltransferase
VTFLVSPAVPWRDILLAELAELGYEGFEEGFTAAGGEQGELKAYIPAVRFDEAALHRLLAVRDPHATVSWAHRTIEPRNWNAEWETAYRPVEVGRAVRIRAAFHPPVPGFAHELIITPRMAFGTGHHATTRLMVGAMLDAGLRGKDVVDLGCGTGVLAILAARMGARSVRAIDNDPVAVENARENTVVNGCAGVIVEKGDATLLEPLSCDAILANIERNTLLDAMPVMSNALRPGGILFLSGFTVEDRHMLAQAAKGTGLEAIERSHEGEWALLGCRKPGDR